MFSFTWRGKYYFHVVHEARSTVQRKSICCDGQVQYAKQKILLHADVHLCIPVTRGTYISYTEA